MHFRQADWSRQVGYLRQYHSETAVPIAENIDKEHTEPIGKAQFAIDHVEDIDPRLASPLAAFPASVLPVNRCIAAGRGKINIIIYTISGRWNRHLMVRELLALTVAPLPMAAAVSPGMARP